MNLIKTGFCAILLVISSCNFTDKSNAVNQNMENVQAETTFISEKEAVVDNDIIDTSLAFPDKWQKLTDIRGVWTNLEKEQNAYVIYNPIEGSTPLIKIDEQDVITIYWANDGPNKFLIMNSSIISKGTEMLLEAENEDGIKAKFIARILDKNKKLVFWKFTINWSITLGGVMDYKWVTTKKEFEKAFKMVDYKNSPNVKGEREFEPINID